MGFIYKITNKVNDKVYIGQTKRTIKIRWKEHLKNASVFDLRNLPLYKAMNKYGKENFSVEEIEECEDSQLDEREIYWISFYDSYYNGYNGTEGGIGGLKKNYEHMEEIAERYAVYHPHRLHVCGQDHRGKGPGEGAGRHLLRPRLVHRGAFPHKGRPHLCRGRRSALPRPRAPHAPRGGRV